MAETDLYRRARERLQWDSDPRRVFCAVNLTRQPMSWRFEVVFCASGLTDLRLEPAEALDVETVIAVLDGGIPEFCKCDAIEFRADGGHTEIPVAQLSGTELLRSVPSQISGLTCKGYWGSTVPTQLQATAQLESYLRRHTRLGSHKWRNGKFSLSIVRLGHASTYKPMSRLSSLPEPKTIPQQLFLDDLGALWVSVVSVGSSETYHSDYGAVSAHEHALFEKVTRHSYGTWHVEIDCSSVSVDGFGRLHPRSRLEAAAAALESRIAELPLDDLEARANQLRHEDAVRKLAARQELARTREWVFFKDTPLGPVPRCENETVLLWQKLEMLGACPAKSFKTVEYTPREGIDALADVQWSSSQTPELAVAIEFEYLFENFFHHGHPQELVRTIICWSGETNALEELTDWSLVSEPQPGVRRVTTPDGNPIWVVFLSDLSGISVRPR